MPPADTGDKAPTALKTTSSEKEAYQQYTVYMHGINTKKRYSVYINRINILKSGSVKS